MPINNVVTVSREERRDLAIHMHMYPFSPQTPLPSRTPHNAGQSSMCYTVGSCWLSGNAFSYLRSALLFPGSVPVILLWYIPPSFITFLMSDSSCCHSFLPPPHLSFPLLSSLVKECSVLALASHALLLNLRLLPPEIQLPLTAIHFQWGKSKVKISSFSLPGLKFSGFLLLLCFIFIFYCKFEILKGLDEGWLLFSHSVMSDS